MRHNMLLPLGLFSIACSSRVGTAPGYTPFTELQPDPQPTASAAPTPSHSSDSASATRPAASRPSACNETVATGTCLENLTRWGFDTEKSVCRRFAYSGCGGTGNNFRTLPDCEATCSPVTSVCDLPLEVGTCEGHTARWGFDAKTRRCIEFDYGGCEGNSNNFQTYDECNSSCGKVAAN